MQFKESLLCGRREHLVHVVCLAIDLSPSLKALGVEVAGHGLLFITTTVCCLPLSSAQAPVKCQSSGYIGSKAEDFTLNKYMACAALHKPPFQLLYLL